MKYRYRILILLLLVGLAPLIAAGIETLRIINQIHTLPVDPGQAVISEVAIQAIRSRFLLTYGVYALVLLGVAYLISGWIASPIEWMATSANQFLRVMQNIWRNLEPPGSPDEVKTLSYTFSVFTQQIREEITNLEKQIQARTADLAGRTIQLETAAQVARESAAILDIDRLLDETSHLISDRFGYYHVGLFLLEETVPGNSPDSSPQEDHYVILQAANSEGGKRMLARGHRLKVGQGIVGTVAAKQEPRIATDVGEDASYFNNPDLPQTRSELALPLRVRSRLIGVLDVQSTASNAYQEEDLRILQIMADQLALAIDNARLIKESQRTLHELELAYAQEARQAWDNRLAQKPLAFSYNRIDIHPTDPLPISPESALENEQYQLVVPIHVRGETLGNIILRRDRTSVPWNIDDLTLVEDAAPQVSSALENARLVEEIRKRAQQEQLISQVSAQFQGSLDVDAVVRTAVQQLGLLPGVSEASIHIDPKTGLTPSSSRQIDYGYYSDKVNLLPLNGNSQELDLVNQESEQVLHLPIRIRGQILGTIHARKADSAGGWTPDDTVLMETLTDQLSIALDNARLYQDSIRAAERERIISSITSKVRASTNVDVILQTAVQELAEALRVSKATVQLHNESPSDGNQVLPDTILGPNGDKSHG